MSLKDVPLKAHYISGVDNLVHKFYIPMLEHSNLYQRRTGYFNSRALAMAGRGLSGLIRNHGKMQLICSVELEEEEREIYEEPSKHVRLLEQKADQVSKMLEQPSDELEEKRLMLLAEVLSRGLLEIKIAFPKAGIYHEKVGIFYDDKGNRCAFSGSDNETPGGWLHNTESFHVFTSWEDARHIEPEIDTFNKLWNNRLSGTTVIPLPEAVKKNIIRYKKQDFDEGYWEPEDPRFKYVRPVDNPDWVWTPELAYIFESPRLWNHQDFAFGEVGITPFQHQDYVAASVLKNWPPRCMLCDEVGLGKTIEAGLILRGFMSAGRLDRTLILAPKNILKQWQLQLFTKFNITAWRLEGNYLEGPTLDPNLPPERIKADSENPFKSRPIILASSQLIRGEARLDQVSTVPWDMILLDEAHHARARGPSGKRDPNLLLRAMDNLKLQTQGLVFMTATPIQIDRKELWDLLMVLELPGGWQDEDSFDAFFTELNEKRPDWGLMFGLAQDTIKAFGVDDSAIQMIQEEYRDVDVERLMQLVKTGKYQVAQGLSPREQEALKILLYRCTPVYRMIFRNTRELLKRYYQEGKIKDRIADREPQVPDSIVLQGDANDPHSELGLYLKIDEYVREYYAKYNAVRKGMGFVMEVYRKRLTSSFHAIKLSLERRKARLAEALRTGDYGMLLGLSQQEIEDSEEEELEEIEESIDPSKLRSDQMRAVIQAEHDFLEVFISQLKNLPHDSKTDYLDRMLRNKFEHGLRRVIIFSQFKDTVDHLLEYLLPQYGEKLGSYSGVGGSFWDGREWVTCSKQKIQQKFTDDADPLAILICTDAAAEGLDLQSCNTLINYDIPWNPMRIEQRIGRIDRIGQKSPKVFIHTFFYQGTVEETVYGRCLERIGYFRTTLGNLQPILIETERLIRNGAMARTREEQQTMLANIDERLEQSIAEVDESIRIFHFLNHYVPQLKVATKTVPVSQEQLEENLAPRLKESGWVHEGEYWTLGQDVITFKPKVMDQKTRSARLITPNSNLVGLFGSLPDILDVTSDPNGRRLHRVEIEGMSVFIFENKNTYRPVITMNDLNQSGGQKFSALEDCITHMRAEISGRREESIRDQLHMWQNRMDGWESRTRMYLGQLLNWRWRDISLKGTIPTDIGVQEVWSDYLRDPDRTSTMDLARTISFRPLASDIQRGVRGRAPTNSPRSSKYESQLSIELKVIHNNIRTLNGRSSQ